MANALENPTKKQLKALGMSAREAWQATSGQTQRLGTHTPLSPSTLNCIVKVGGVAGELRPLAQSKSGEGASGRWHGAERGKSPPK